MDHIEKAIIYLGSYFMLFIAAISLQMITDLPEFYDVLIFIACVYIIWARDEIFAYHIIGKHVVISGGKIKSFISSILRIFVGLVILKLMILGFFQVVMILYLIDFLTWVWADRALSQVLTLCKIERKQNESKA